MLLLLFYSIYFFYIFIFYVFYFSNILHSFILNFKFYYIYNLYLLHKSKEKSRIDHLQTKAQQSDYHYQSDADVNHGFYNSDFDDDDEEYSSNVQRIVALLKETGPELYVHEDMDAS